ncbi:MAG: hypothetical protein JWN17_277 [Frankiales bacterium]|nr:hypothetical protein [Frankiales bacterium]
MALFRRSLRDVGTRVSGVLGALRDEVVPEVLGGRPAEQSEADAPTADAPAADEPAADATAADEPAADADAGDGPAADEPLRAHPTGLEAAASPVVDAAVDDTGAVSSPTTVDVPAPAPSAPALDDVCAAAVELARAAALEEARTAVGEHLGAEPEDALTVTHSFASTDPAYVGWRWAVTVARAEGSDVVTVDEVVLLPGGGALLAPAWVPYSERVQPGDLGTGDLLPPEPDDPRLVPAYADPEAELAEAAYWELGLGRPRVLSLDGRADAAERWYDGDTGPASPRALAAPGQCVGCGFLVPLGGALRQAFGVCANASAPDDGRVVALSHGCGAHSETPAESSRPPVAELVVDEVEYTYEDRGPAAIDSAADADLDAAPGSAADDAPDESAADPLPDPVETEQAEELGHS